MSGKQVKTGAKGLNSLKGGDLWTGGSNPLATAGKVLSFMDGITGAFGLNTEQVNQAAADRAGMGAANKATGILNMIPGVKFMTAFGATITKKAVESAY